MTTPPPERPQPTAWGAAIMRHRCSAGLSIRRAADLSRAAGQRPGSRDRGITEGRWRQIEHGYEVVTAGAYAPVRGSADAVAAMASVVGMGAPELRDTGRADAAAILERMQPPFLLADQVRNMPPDQAGALLAELAWAMGVRSPIVPASARRYGT